LGSSRIVTILIIVAALSLSLISSCGDDNGAGPRCVNCDFWQKAFGRIGRFPAVSPVDARLVAFSSPDTFACSATDYNHIWIAELPAVEGEDTEFFQITCAYYHDFIPVWSPDGKTIAFERRFGASLSDIYTVDVTDISAPGAPVEFTHRATLPEANFNPAWLTLEGETWLAFSNCSSGGNDYDLAMYDYPARSQLVWLSIDPADIAKNENNVLSYVFKDVQVASAGSDVVAFTSPDRVRVGDVRVVARSEESAPDTTAAARIYISGKDSGRTTPYVFRYRPTGSQTVEIKGNLSGYCVDAVANVMLQPDVVNTVFLDFEYSHGTVGFASDPGVRLVFLDGVKLNNFRTAALPTQYTFVDCVAETTHTAFAANIVGEQACSPPVEFEVVGGETTLVFLDCTTALSARGAAPSARSLLGASAGRAASQQLAEGPNGLWVADLGNSALTGDDVISRAAGSEFTISGPSVSPDGKYVAFIVGESRTREIVVADISGLLAGGTDVPVVEIGMPGSDADVECWRIPERVAWLPTESGRKLIASLSVCGSAAVPDEFEVWIADVSRFIE
jgi:hypothetical protein